jgi:hypothetical protein
MTPAQVAAGTLRARTIELGVAANRVRQASCDYADHATLSPYTSYAFVELQQVVARLHEITRALATAETPA